MVTATRLTGVQFGLARKIFSVWGNLLRVVVVYILLEYIYIYIHIYIQLEDHVDENQGPWHGSTNVLSSSRTSARPQLRSGHDSDVDLGAPKLQTILT